MIVTNNIKMWSFSKVKVSGQKRHRKSNQMRRILIEKSGQDYIWYLKRAKRTRKDRKFCKTTNLT